MPTSYEVLGELVACMTYWHVARKVPLANDSFVLEDYVEHLREFIEFLRPVTLGVSVRQSILPALFTISSIARNGESTRKSMAPTSDRSDVRRGRTVVCELVLSKRLDSFERGLIDIVEASPLSEGRSAFPGLVRGAFVEMSLSHSVTSHPDFSFCIAVGDTEAADSHRCVYDEFGAVLDRSAECYLKTVCVAFQVVRRQAITDIALTSIEVERHLAPGPAPRRTRPQHRLRYVAHALRALPVAVAAAFFLEHVQGAEINPRIHDEIRRYEPSGRVLRRHRRCHGIWRLSAYAMRRGQSENWGEEVFGRSR
ncbi:hypothetical protein WN982_27815 [Paraburkholderia sp. IMGN_8]|uniref:hypothetical protein n=1 Tax=Paraburkholderia sp. IMGN_8 TaxID=3136564 RepID=UPI00310110FD